MLRFFENFDFEGETVSKKKEKLVENFEKFSRNFLKFRKSEIAVL